MKASFWCTINNSMLGQEKISPEDYKPRNLALIPCTKETCERWKGGECVLLVKVENGRRK
jgi:hypothetical protein